MLTHVQGRRFLVKSAHYFPCFLCVTDPDAIPDKTEVKMPYLGAPVTPGLEAYKYSSILCLGADPADATDERRPLPLSPSDDISRSLKPLPFSKLKSLPLLKSILKPRRV